MKGKLPSSDRRTGRIRRTRGLAACGLAALLLAIAMAGAAHAQLGDPGTQTLDTDVTPVAKESERWSWVAGAKYSSDGPKPSDVPEDSVTPFEADLFTVSFHEPGGGEPAENGFAGGAVCRAPVPAGASPEEARDHTDTCERVPVIYRYSVNDIGEASWEEVYRGTSPGYVGAIDWISEGRALAVGGTGAYPRREESPSTPENDPAKDGRAWLYENGSWRELTDLPAGMRGMSALDVSPRPSDCGPGVTSVCAVAGGFRQLWMFEDGSFTRGVSDQSPDSALDRAYLFQFRVRDVSFATGSSPGAIKALAATSGCCAADELQNGPRLLVFDGTRWYLRQREGDPSNASNVFYQESEHKPVQDEWEQYLGEGTFARNAYDLLRKLSPGDVLPELPKDSPAQEQTDAIAEIYQQPHPGLDRATSPYGGAPGTSPESFYALLTGTSGTTGGLPYANFQVVTTPGGPPPEGDEVSEPASQFISGSVRIDRGRRVDAVALAGSVLPFDINLTASNLQKDVPGNADKLLSTLRLHDFDESAVEQMRKGDPALGTTQQIEAVGVLGASGQGVAYGPQERFPDRTDKGLHGCEIVLDEGKAECDPDAERFINAYASRNLYILPSYALNSVQVVDDITGTGWAVGDHGAILSLAGESAAQAQSLEPAPPRLGNRKPQELPGSEAYDPFRRPLTGEPGIVPRYGALSTEQLREPRFVAAGIGSGSPIVMSRDGSEGWAFGQAPSGGVRLYRYDGATWESCPPESDYACAGIATLLKDGQSRITGAGRVPLENDADPANDDELEVVAVGMKGNQPFAVRYRDGRWAVDDEATKAGVGGRDVIFTAPDDGWIGASHFDGEGWTNCALNKLACGDPDGRLFVEGEVGGAGFALAAVGERVYKFVTRRFGGAGAGATGQQAYPMIIYRDTDKPCEPPDETEGCWRGGEDRTDDGVYNPTDGGWDPMWDAKRKGVATPNPDNQGRVWAVMATEESDGSLTAWATGQFNGLDANASAVMLRLTDQGWQPYATGDAADELLAEVNRSSAPDPRQHLALPREAGPRTAYVFQGSSRPALTFNEEAREGKGRWEVLPTPWVEAPSRSFNQFASGVRTVDGDGSGGFWATAAGSFYHYTDRPPKPVFEDVPLPARNDRVTAMAPGGDGSLWLGDESGFLYRYDRIGGWSRGVPVPGWNPPRSTTATAINAIALGPDGRGIAVGDGGRIAQVGPEAVGLDPAAGTLCDFAQPTPPCGTGRDLNDAAVAPDGSALAVGDAATLLWSPAGEGFRRLEPPRLQRGVDFTAVRLPTPDTAYVLIDERKLLRGELRGGAWSWSFEIGTLTAQDPLTGGQPLNDLAIDASGHGYAVGDDGLLLKRETGESGAWRRREAGYPDDLQAVALPTGGGDGLLVGAEGGAVLTLIGERLEVARPLDTFDPVVHVPVANGFSNADTGAIALAPGVDAGQVEAWLLISGRTGLLGRSPAPQALLHYASHPDEPLLDPTQAAKPLADTPPPRPSELAFAAFGKQDCQTARHQAGTSQLGAAAPCLAGNGSNLTNDLIAERVRGELLDRADRAGGPQFALFTGDAVDNPGGGAPLARTNIALSIVPRVRSPIDRNAKHRRWVELVADPLAAGGVPLFGAPGGQDLAVHPEAGTGPTTTDLYFGGDLSAKQLADGAGVRGGLNLPWRNTVAAMPAPWERAEGETGSLDFERLEGGALSQETPAVESPEATASTPGVSGSGIVPPWAGVRVEPHSTAGAPTHYATDVIRDGEKVARIVVADTSMGSLAASNPGQHPIEVGGQERWLEEVLCFDGSATDTDDDIRDCTREPGQLAIVLTNTPTYSYGPISPDETMRDAAAFEAIMLRNQVNVVVSGRLGWNGLYWATAPGVHEPCPSGAYQTEPPKPGVRSCGQGNAELDEAVNDAQGETQELADGTPIGTLPFVVSSTAGGRFNERAERSGTTTAENGFWRGYSIVRLDASGDPAKTIVEQRPILDWVGIEAGERALEPRASVTLEGYAREAFGLDTPARYIEIASPAITHRYDLLLADPEEPWVPCEAGDPGCEALYAKLAEGPRNTSAARSDAGAEGSGALGTAQADGGACDPYVCLPERVGTVDSQSGEVNAGNGKYPDTFAIGMLSVGDHVATYPLVFKRSPSFVVNPAVARPSAPNTAADSGFEPQVPPPPNVPKPNVPQPGLPELPALPGIPPLSAAQPPEPQPPAPPSPPPPSQQPAPLDLTVSPQSIAIATPTAVIQPPTPPVNPAPPGGARREARQRQAATQKSGADGAQTETQELAGDTAQGPPSSNPGAFTRYEQSFTRRAQGRPEPSFTPLQRSQPTASGQAVLYAGGITLLAATLALGFTTLRPGPRRRPPEVPSPAWSQARIRRQG